MARSCAPIVAEMKGAPREVNTGVTVRAPTNLNRIPDGAASPGGPGAGSDVPCITLVQDANRVHVYRHPPPMPPPMCCATLAGNKSLFALGSGLPAAVRRSE